MGAGGVGALGALGVVAWGAWSAYISWENVYLHTNLKNQGYWRVFFYIFFYITPYIYPTPIAIDILNDLKLLKFQRYGIYGF